MSGRKKYLYRIRGTVVLKSVLDGAEIRYGRTWHYQNKASAEERFLKARDGWSQTVRVDGVDKVWRHDPLDNVTFERSDPITWSQSPAAELPPAPAGKVRRRLLRVLEGGAA